MLCLKLIFGFFLFTFILLAFLFIPAGKEVQAHSIYCGIPPEPAYTLDNRFLPHTGPIPSSPTTVTASAVGQQITFSWSATTGCYAWFNGLVSENFWRYTTATSVTFTGTCGTTYTPSVGTIMNVDLQFAGYCCNIGHPAGWNHSATTDRPTFGNSVTATCAPPFTISAGIGSCNVNGTQNVNLSWSNPPAGTLSFPILRNTSPVYGGIILGCVNAPGSTFTDNPPVGTWYYWTFGSNAPCGAGGGGSNSNIAGPITTVSCASPPTVRTDPASSITTTSATINGAVTSDGGSALTGRGFQWAQKPAGVSCPAIGTYNVSSVPGGVGTYSAGITGLTPNTTYCFVATATNSVGSGSGVFLEFTTTGPPGPFSISPNPPTASCISGTTPAITVSWTASFGATSYNVFRFNSLEGIPPGSALSVAVGLTTTTYVDPTGTNNSQPGPTALRSYQYIVRAVNSLGTLDSPASSLVTALNCANPTVDLLANGLLAGVGGSITIPSGSSANLTWTSTNATTCSASRSPVTSTGWTGSKVLINTSPGENTGSLTTPPSLYTYTLTCTNGNNGTLAFDNVGINVLQLPPWIQTTDGDVHSNVEINTPGGP